MIVLNKRDNGTMMIWNCAVAGRSFERWSGISQKAIIY